MITADPQALAAICKTQNVKALYVFGSFARNEETDSSDVDVVVEFGHPSHIGAFDRYMGLKEALESLFKRPVDLLNARSLKNPIFKEEVESSKILLYAA